MGEQDQSDLSDEPERVDEAGETAVEESDARLEEVVDDAEPTQPVAESDLPSDERVDQSDVSERAKSAPEGKKTAPKAHAPNHWFNLASSLGLDVPPPEPEEEPSADAAAEEVTAGEPEPEDVEAAGQEPLEAEPRRDQDEEVADAREKSADDGSSISPAEAKPLSLFEDPDLQLDAPGVLDAVFDGDDAAIAQALRSGRKSRDAVGDSEEEADQFAETPGFVADVEEFLEEEPDEELEAAGGEDTGEAEIADEQKQGRRRKRRRRRKPSRRDRGESDGAADEEIDVTEGVEEQVDRGKSDSAEPQETQAHPSAPDEATVKTKHKKIPTWEEAIGVLVSANLETRSRNSGGGSRGRGRRSRR